MTAPDTADPVAGTEALLGHHFTRPDLLREALTHRSAVELSAQRRGRRGARKGAGSYERLEFLGDRVLGLLVAEWLNERFPDEAEGDLARRHAHLVSQPVIAEIATGMGLARVLDVAPGEARAGVKRLATVLADATEALIGAMYLDGGLEPARAFVRRAWAQALEAQAAAPPKDAKTLLQEWVHARSLPLPAYVVASREGPPHAPVFVVRVCVAGQTGTGTGGAKQAAEQEAAADLLRRLAGGAEA